VIVLPIFKIIQYDVLVPKCSENIDLKYVCKEYSIVETSGKDLCIYKLSRMSDVIDNHKVTNLHELLLLEKCFFVTIAPTSLIAGVTSFSMM